MKLYNSRGPNPLVVRMFMAEKGIELPMEEVDIMAGINRQADYLKINAAGQCPALELDDREEFFSVVRAGFSAPRKQLRNSLAQGLKIPLEESLALLETTGIDSRRRAQTLCLGEWGALYHEAQRGYIHAGPGPRQD